MTHDASAVDEAKAVIASHEQFTKAGDLDGIMTNVADDIVMFAPDAPLVQGSDAFREFYTGLLGLGQWDFRHDYEGAEVIGDTVLLHGIARGTLTPNDGDTTPLANNFLLVLRRQADGKLRVWRGAFAPSGA